MGLKKFTFVIFLMMVAGFPAFAQRDSVGLTKLVSKTEKLSTEHPFEKVYLHFDKPYYAVGDTIWFKAYTTIGTKHLLSALSSIVYVDLINSRDSLIKSLKVSALSGIGFGDITLSPQTFKQGNYHIRAYTNWMRNFGADYFFNKTISIANGFDITVTPKISFIKTKKNNGEVINARMQYSDRDRNSYANKKVTWTVQNEDETINKGKGITDQNGFLAVTLTGDKPGSSNSASLVTVIDMGNKKFVTNTFPLKSVFAAADVQFFPEGGELITGVRSKVAFKAVNPDGLGVDVTGIVTDETGKEVADLTSQHAGMGIFALLPETGKTYKATITFPDGSKHNYDLPNVRTDGIDLAVNNSDPENLNIKIATNAEYFQRNQNKSFYIIAQGGGTIYYTALAALQSQVYTAVVAKNRFPTGVLQLTLFAADGDPLSERVVFIQHNDALNLALTTNLPSYTTRQNVKMTVLAKNNNLPIEGSFSVAVIDENKVPFNEDSETTILSSLLLTSDLRGYIEKPNYYFNHPDEEKLASLDILMLTQGYRRFSYTNIMADKYPPVTFLPEQGMDISGTLRTSTGLPVYKGNVIMLLPDKNYSQNAITDADGKFKFPNVFFPDSSKIILSARNNSGSNDLMITADVPTYQAIAKSFNNPDEITNIDSALSAYLQNSKKQIENSHVLKEVEIKSTRTTKKVTHESYTALKGLSIEADQVLGADILKYCSFDFEGCVLSKVFGLWHIENSYYIKRDYDKGNKKPIKFFINGLAIDDTYISNINPADIESIEVYLKDGVSGTMRFYDCNGIISVTTKSHSFTPKDLNKTDMAFLTAQGSSITIQPKGFYRARVFYSPKYNKPQNTARRIADLRTTIYWNPSIITDKNGNASFEYYNADGKGTYRAVIEGIDGDGNIGRYVLRYNVK